MGQQPSPPLFRVTKRRRKRPIPAVSFQLQQEREKKGVEGWEARLSPGGTAGGGGQAIRKMRSTPSETFKVLAP